MACAAVFIEQRSAVDLHIFAMMRLAKHQHQTAGGFYLFVAIIVAHSALITDAFFHHNIRMHRSIIDCPSRAPASLDNMPLNCDNVDECFTGEEEQHFIFKLEDRCGTCLDPRQYLDVETDDGGYYLPSCGNIVIAMIADPISHRLEFTVKAAKKLRRGWKLTIHSVYGRRNKLGQRSTRIGKILFEDEDFLNNYDVLSYECYVESHYKSTYWKETDGEKVKIGTTICTIVANVLRERT